MSDDVRKYIWIWANDNFEGFASYTFTNENDTFEQTQTSLFVFNHSDSSGSFFSFLLLESSTIQRRNSRQKWIKCKETGRSFQWKQRVEALVNKMTIRIFEICEIFKICRCNIYCERIVAKGRNWPESFRFQAVLLTICLRSPSLSRTFGQRHRIETILHNIPRVIGRKRIFSPTKSSRSSWRCCFQQETTTLDSEYFWISPNVVSPASFNS